MAQFFIKQNSYGRLVSFELSKSENVTQEYFDSQLQNATIKFTMYDTRNKPYILNGVGGISFDNETNQRYVYYEFKHIDTLVTGEFIGDFTFTNFDEGVLITPIENNFLIVIHESLLFSDYICDTETTEFSSVTNLTILYGSYLDAASNNEMTIYYVVKNTDYPVYLDKDLTIPINGYIKNIDEQIVYLFENGYPVESKTVSEIITGYAYFPYTLPIILANPFPEI